MSKRPLRLKFRIPPYRSPRNAWRRAINAEAVAARERRRIRYSATDRLEVAVTLYMLEVHLTVNDVDNRMKDIFDALQGRAGGSKSKRTLPTIIPNDNQIFRVEMEKTLPPKQALGRGHVVVRKFRERKGTRRR